MSSEPNQRQWVLAALDQYESRLLRYAHRLTGCLDEARDVVQFVFLRLCDQSPAEIDRRLPQWLYTVCRNRSLDVLKANGRAVGWDKLASASAGPPSGNGTPHIPASSRRDPVGRELNPADIAEQSDLHALLRTLIDKLPTNQREALDLWSDGFSYLHISEITNHTEGHIRVLIHRALKTLREHPRVQMLTDDDDMVRPPRKKLTTGLAPVD